jgi:site-specific recombinase XerD
MKTYKSFAALLEAFFMDRLMKQRQASQHTIASYRDTFRLLLLFLKEQYNIPPSNVTLSDLKAPVIVNFLGYLERQRCNKPRSRNIRLAAIRSFFHYIAFEEPGYADLIQRVLAIPSKKWNRKLVSFLSREETDVMVNAPNVDTFLGKRDHILLALASQTGLRVSEITNLKCRDVIEGSCVYIHCQGKGRKERSVPLTKSTGKKVITWLRQRQSGPEDYIFKNSRGKQLSRDGVAYILDKYVVMAQQKCPSLRTKRVSPHVLRHTTAVNLLEGGVDQSVIALWLGHESVETTQIYLHASLAYKEKILGKITEGKGKMIKYRPSDRLLNFLNSL